MFVVSCLVCLLRLLVWVCCQWLLPTCFDGLWICVCVELPMIALHFDRLILVVIVLINLLFGLYLLLVWFLFAGICCLRYFAYCVWLLVGAIGFPIVVLADAWFVF